jgi:hypothetical protein
MSILKVYALIGIIFFTSCSHEESCSDKLKSGSPLFSEQIKNSKNVFTISGPSDKESFADSIELLEFDLEKKEIRSIRKFCWDYLGQATYIPNREVMIISSTLKDGITITDGSSKGTTYKFGYNLEYFFLWKNYVLAHSLALVSEDTIAFKDSYPHGSYWDPISMYYFNLDTKEHSKNIFSAWEAGRVEDNFLYLSGSSDDAYDFKRMKLSENHNERYWETLQHIKPSISQASREEILNGEHYKVPVHTLVEDKTIFLQNEYNRLFTTKDANGTYKEIKKFDENRVNRLFATDNSLYIFFDNSDKVVRYFPDTKKFSEYKLPREIKGCIALNYTESGNIILYFNDGLMNNGAKKKPQTLYATDQNFSVFTKPYIVKDSIHNLSTNLRPFVSKRGCLK